MNTESPFTRKNPNKYELEYDHKVLPAPSISYCTVRNLSENLSENFSITKLKQPALPNNLFYMRMCNLCKYSKQVLCT